MSNPEGQWGLNGAGLFEGSGSGWGVLEWELGWRGRLKVRSDLRIFPTPRAAGEKGFSWDEEQGFFSWLWPRLGPSLHSL